MTVKKQINPKVTAEDVANYFLLKSDPEIGDIISNLKLQKLVYYAQGFHLAMFDKSLFDEEIEAWEHGPVVRQLYQKYKKHGSDAITKPSEFNPSIFTKKQVSLLDEIYLIIGQYSAWKLRNLTHSEPPWIKARKGNGTILADEMKRYFKKRIRHSD